jgi:hypothetical protein
LFGIDDVVSSLRKEFIEEGFIRNKYGRKVMVPELRLLYNSYVQSTGVDVALLGFRDLIRRFEGVSKDIRPIALIHDDMLVDCPAQHVDFLLSLKEVQIEGYTDPFFVKTKLLKGKT